MTGSGDDPVDRYVALLTALTPARLDDLKALCAPEVRFADPFNDVVGPDRVAAVFADMFARVHDMSFEVTDRCGDARRAYLRWIFRFRTRPGGKMWTFTGVAEVHFDAEGRLSAHLDHWDAAGQLYEKLPLIGTVLRALRRRLAV